jgi:hypothetical protein
MPLKSSFVIEEQNIDEIPAALPLFSWAWMDAKLVIYLLRGDVQPLLSKTKQKISF